MDHRECKQCGILGNFKEILTPTLPHHGKYVCIECGTFHSWIPKPKNETKRIKNKHTAESLNIWVCQMCLRPLHQLGTSEVLEVHHVHEIQHGGEDVESNIWCVCTPCHKTIHHNRLYLHEHHKTKITPERLIQLMDRDNVPESVRGYMLKMLESQRG